MAVAYACDEGVDVRWTGHLGDFGLGNQIIPRRLEIIDVVVRMHCDFVDKYRHIVVSVFERGWERSIIKTNSHIKTSLTGHAFLCRSGVPIFQLPLKALERILYLRIC